MNDLKKVKATCCEGEGQGSCKRCVDKGIWNRMWMSFLYKIEGLEGCYCAKCVDEIMEEMKWDFLKWEEIDEDTFTKQAGSYESIFVSGSQRGKDRAGICSS